MSRITDMVLEPHVTYTGKTFTVKVKVQDSYFYKKYLISENIKYTTAEGTTFTLTNINATQIGSILKLTGKTVQQKLPDQYQEVEYIQSSGTQYIDTGVIPNQDTRVIADFMITTNNLNWVFGARNGTNLNTYCFLIYGAFRSDYNTTQGNLQILWDRCVADKNKNVTTTYKNGVQNAQDTQTYATFTPNLNMYLFTINDNGTANTSGAYIKLYSCKIYNNETLVRSFIPCYRKSDNVVGLYDLITKTFYRNSGTGSFTKGSNVTNNSPTPSAPIEIQNVGKDNNIFITNKNILTNSDMTQSPGNNDNWVMGTMNNVTSSSWSNEGLTVTTPASGNLNNGRTIQLKRANEFIPAGTTVTFSIDITGTGVFGRIRGFYQGPGTAWYSYSVQIVADTSTTDTTTKRYSGTFIMPDLGDKGRDFYIALSQGNTAVTTRTYKNAQLEISQTETSYTKNEGTKYRIDLGGKNILQVVNTERIINGVKFTPQPDGSILVDGTATGGNATYPINRDSTSPGFSIPVEAYTTYVISKSSPGNVSNILFQMYWNKDGTTTYSTGSFTTTAAAEIGAYIRVTSGTTITNTKIYLQIEKRKHTNRIQPIR